MTDFKPYFKRVGTALDILLNVITGGKLETVSSRCGKQILNDNPCKTCDLLCRLLNLRWMDHCKNNTMPPLDTP